MTQKFTSDIIIGLEIHVELDTNSKLFCSCSTENTEEPNKHTCQVCLGHPGSKPVLNKQAVEFAIRLCLALNCRLNPKLIFSRKNYFYPDMAKNYQITQYEIPLGTGGKLSIANGKEIGIVRVHMEEDPASLVHLGSMETSPFVLVDYNRSGRPLCEVVTKPDMTGPDEARDFMKKLITVLNYIGIFDQNNCIIKADANVSIKESGYVRSEVKNITGFKEIERALRYEVERQKRDFKEGKRLILETRAWDSDKGITIRLRTKETEEDYGYILDPDLVVTEITEKWVGEVKKEMPELAQDKIQKFISKYKIDRIDAEVIAAERPLAEMFEEVAKKVNPQLAARWMRIELVRVMNYNEKTFDDIPVKSSHIIELLEMVEKREITDNVAKKIMERFMNEAFSPRAYAKEQGLKVVSDSSELEKVCRDVIRENPKAVEDVKAGNEKSLNFLIGQVMRRTKGQASPKELNEIIKKMIK
ncbi:Asp-tRNA(Asn)/Glu-tRNA(Gln) amidotransferase GatCAB subunit B [Candidatus Woesearchaeota archaeon CG10_big_fil_rev_8_21_14_0_10_44_13]|nr:MAG: Asp-tRNA(Asn)/Glu-tRNA(Gln) amidotransferase GatCAB subunit B [Candidatus Woesearchaeota archaeon CG10_big_fil_rev_8_21_14_0_10_44_13]